MATYHFTLQVSGIEGEPEEVFYGHGADDALIYFADGNLFLAFDREAASAAEAIDSAAILVRERGGDVVRVIREDEKDIDRQAAAG